MVAAMQMTDETPKGCLHSRIGFKLQRTARVFEKCIELSLRHSGLSRVNWRILLALHEHNLTSPSEISDFVGIDRTATSRALRQLEELGTIKRSIDHSDRRMTQVKLTKRGVELMAYYHPSCYDHLQMIEGRLTPEELDQLRYLLCKLNGHEAPEGCRKTYVQWVAERPSITCRKVTNSSGLRSIAPAASITQASSCEMNSTTADKNP